MRNCWPGLIEVVEKGQRQHDDVIIAERQPFGLYFWRIASVFINTLRNIVSVAIGIVMLLSISNISTLRVSSTRSLRPLRLRSSSSVNSSCFQQPHHHCSPNKTRPLGSVRLYSSAPRPEVPAKKSDFKIVPFLLITLFGFGSYAFLVKSRTPKNVSQ